MRYWVQNVGNLDWFEMPEFIVNIPDVARASQAIGIALVVGLSSETRVFRDSAIAPT